MSTSVNGAVFSYNSTELTIAQIAFMGVRRQVGCLPQLTPPYQYTPHPYSYVLKLIIGQQYSATQVPIPGVQLVTDYDFELWDLRIGYQPFSGSIPSTKVISKLWIQDAARNYITSAPIFDQYINDNPFSSYANSGFAVPLVYPNQSRISVEVYSLVVNAAYLPITMTLHFEGINRVPC